MKKIFTVLFLSSLVVTVARAQQASPETRSTRCATQEEFLRNASTDPDALERKARFDFQVEQSIQQSNGQAQRGVLKVVPVVVHVLHDCGSGNITKEQILDGIRIINEDFRRLNADTSSTPAAFRLVAADPEVEFRLAQLDPDGNCTDGIVRVQSNRTNLWNPRDSLKNVSHWPSHKYLNIWLVNSIYDQNGAGGTILGYAQFPWDFSSRPSTDGVVIRHDFFGSIGTAATSGNAGRVATHEIGHWLGLTHIWGDDAGACTGSDNCADTPNSADQVFGCPNYPLNDACNATPNGIMFMNYMDYTDGICQNIFTVNQKTRMENAFSAYRNYIKSTANLNATGTNGTPMVTCTPVADVCIGTGYYTCAGSSVNFVNASYNADTMTYTWNFPGGSPSSSTDQHPTIMYSTPGVYGFSLVSTSSVGSDTVNYNNKVMISGPATITPITTSTMEDFELASSFPSNGYVINMDGGITWQRVTNTGSSGVASLKIDNFNNVKGEIDEYITPPYDLQYLIGPQMKFKRANAQRSVTSNDVLNVYVSTNCGATWTNRKNLAGAALATAGVVGSSFTPSTPSHWVLTTVNPSASGATNVRFKFENVSDGGNNTYIDDINITAISVVGIEETAFEKQGFNVFPNPASGSATVSYQIAATGHVELSLLDVTGRQVRRLLDDRKETGIHSLHLDVTSLGKGIYFLNLQTPNSNLTTRFIVD